MQTITVKIKNTGEYPYLVKETRGQSVWMVTGPADERGRFPAEFIGGGFLGEHPFHWKENLNLGYYTKLDRTRLMIIIGNR
jgi:hypothetical protein